MPKDARASEAPVYRIELRGHLDHTWVDRFPDFALEHSFDPDGSAVTILRGPVADEAALHGHLARVRDLGVPLLLVERET